MQETQPGWQVDPCPAWCRVRHGEHDHPDDRVHRSDGVCVPVVLRRTWFEGEGIRRDLEAAEFDVALSCVDGESETLLYVGDGPSRSFDLTADSADRLARALAELLRSR